MLLQGSLVESAPLLMFAIAMIALLTRLTYNIFFHPLARFSGPWYACATSLTGAIASVLHFRAAMASKTDTPIRISPNVLLFSSPKALRSIYWESGNTKSSMFGSGVLGPPHLFTICDAEEHKIMRKALAEPQWSITHLKKHLEVKANDIISLFMRNLAEKAERGTHIDLSKKSAEFAADIVTVFTFGEPWGFVQNDRDERHLLSHWHKGLHMFAIVSHWRTFRENILPIPWVRWWLLPRSTDENGVGYIMAQADREVRQRESKIQQDSYVDGQDFLQHCLDTRIEGKRLPMPEVRSSINLLLEAGIDPTGTAINSTIRFLLLHPSCLARALEEIRKADEAGYLSAPVKFEETRIHLPYLVACIREAIRLEPPATNIFARMVGSKGQSIGGFEIPSGTDITSCAYVVQRDPELYAPDPHSFRPERWLESTAKSNEMEAGSFAFGMGPRACIGKDVALMTIYKFIPEILRRFELGLVNEGSFVVAGGIAYNKGFIVKAKARA